MPAVLNLARATCAAESREGSTSASVRNRRQAAPREIGVSSAVAKSAGVADSAYEKGWPYVSNFFTSKLARSEPTSNSVRRWQRSYWRSLATIIADPGNPCLGSFRQNNRPLKE